MERPEKVCPKQPLIPRIFMKKFIFIVLLFCISQSAFAEQKNAPAKVIMNNQELTQVQLAEIKKVYGVQPKSGKYWCDKTSGLWGQWEGPAMGFLFQKHCVGELSPSASKGSSKVFINNREVSQNEALWWTARAGGGYPMPGKYTLDQQGNLAGLNAFGVPFVVKKLSATSHNRHSFFLSIFIQSTFIQNPDD